MIFNLEILIKMTPDEFIDKHEVMHDTLKDPAINDIHRMYALLNDKSASLFGHVSLMIAACTFLYGRDSPTSAFFLFEAVGYLLIALALISVLNVSMYTAPESLADKKIFFARSCRFRVILFVICLYGTMLMTLAVLLTIFSTLILSLSRAA